LKDIALHKPEGSTFVVDVASNVVICARIWRGQPTSNILLQLVTCEAASTYLRDREYEAATDVLSRGRCAPE
jgi:hypothetical protein